MLITSFFFITLIEVVGAKTELLQKLNLFLLITNKYFFNKKEYFKEITFYIYLFFYNTLEKKVN